jgi:hypothetical protein
VGWWAANLSCELFRVLYPNRYLRLRYEDLARSPKDVLECVLDKVSPQPGVEIRDVSCGNNRHQLYGNRMRHMPPTFSRVEEDTRWKTAMPPLQRRLITCLSWPLRERYGY